MAPKPRSTRVTTGLKWAPDTAPSIQIRATRAPAVAAAFSSSCRPTSSGDSRLAMIPDPMTATTSSPVPSASATSRRAGRCRARRCRSRVGRRVGHHAAATSAVMRLAQLGHGAVERRPAGSATGSGIDQCSHVGPASSSSWARSQTVTTSRAAAGDSSSRRGCGVASGRGRPGAGGDGAGMHAAGGMGAGAVRRLVGELRPTARRRAGIGPSCGCTRTAPAGGGRRAPGTSSPSASRWRWT